MEAHVVQVLSSTLVPDNELRNRAEAELKNLENTNFGQFMYCLTAALMNESVDPSARQQAGINMKNALYSDNPIINEDKSKRWMSLPADQRSIIKSMVVPSLNSGAKEVRRAGAQAIAAMGAVELNPLFGGRSWPELIPGLIEFASSPSIAGTTKEATIRTIGYLCEDISVEWLQENEVNHILQAVVTCMGPAQEVEVRRSANAAMYNLLLFASTNMERENERNIILNAIGTSTMDPDETAAIGALNSAARIASDYYEYLEPCFDAFANVTIETSAKYLTDRSTESRCVSSLEFWFELAEQEHDLKITQDTRYRGFCARSAPKMVNLLTSIMVCDDEDASPTDTDNEDDEAAAPSYASRLLGELADTVGDQMLDSVLAFVGANISHADWNRRNAATIALTKVICGAKAEEKIHPILTTTLPGLLQRITQGPTADPSLKVRDSSAWALGEIMEKHQDAMLQGDFHAKVAAILQPLISCLNDVPRVASQAAFAITSLCKCAEEYVANQARNGNDNPENPLNKYFEAIYMALIPKCYDDKWNCFELRKQCAYAASALIDSCRYAPSDTPKLIASLKDILERLKVSIQAIPSLTANAAENRNNLLSKFAEILSTIIVCLDKEVIPYIPVTVEICTMLADYFKTPNEDVIRAIGTLAVSAGDAFTVYLPVIRDRLLAALSEKQSIEIMKAAAITAGQVAMATNEQFSLLARDIVYKMGDALSDRLVDKEVKTYIISSFGDICLSVASHPSSSDFLPHILSSVQSAAGISIPTDADGEEDPIEADYVLKLRCACVEAWCGSLIAFQNKPQEEVTKMMGQAAGQIVGFIQGWCEDIIKRAQEAERFDTMKHLIIESDVMDTEAELLRSLINLVGDIGNVFGPQATINFFNPKTMPWAAAALKIAHYTDLTDWGGNNRDENGDIKLTCSQYCLQELNIKFDL